MNKPNRNLIALCLLLSCTATGCREAPEPAAPSASPQDVVVASSPFPASADVATPPPAAPIVQTEYKEVDLTFIPHETVNMDTFDPDAPWVSPYNGNTYPSLRACAQNALRELYHMTGYQAKDCYVTCYDTPEARMFFSYGADDFAFSSFFSSSYDPFTGNLGGMTIMYEHKGEEYLNVYPLIDPAAVKHPDQMDALNDEEIALWYYNHSTLKTGDIVRTEVTPTDYIQLYMQDGTYYDEVTLDREYRFISSIRGPIDPGVRLPQ